MTYTMLAIIYTLHTGWTHNFVPTQISQDFKTLEACKRAGELIVSRHQFTCDERRRSGFGSDPGCKAPQPFYICEQSK